MVTESDLLAHARHRELICVIGLFFTFIVFAAGVYLYCYELVTVRYSPWEGIETEVTTPYRDVGTVLIIFGVFLLMLDYSTILEARRMQREIMDTPRGVSNVGSVSSQGKLTSLLMRLAGPYLLSLTDYGGRFIGKNPPAQSGQDNIYNKSNNNSHLATDDIKRRDKKWSRPIES